MEIRIENTVQEPVMAMPEERIGYNIVVALLQNLHSQGELNDKQNDTAKALAGMSHKLENTSIFINK